MVEFFCVSIKGRKGASGIIIGNDDKGQYPCLLAVRVSYRDGAIYKEIVFRIPLSYRKESNYLLTR